MIVKTIEEMNDTSNNFNVIQTLRIFEEKIDPKRKKSIFLNHTRGDSKISQLASQSMIKLKLSQFLKSKSSITNGDPNPVEEKRRIPRYEQIEKIIVSDSGPRSQAP